MISKERVIYLKHRLNVFKGNPFKWYRPEAWAWFFRSFVCLWQRATKGYCFRDVWALDDFYSVLFINTLEELAEITHGYPQEFLVNYPPTDIEDDKGFRAWQDMLFRIARHFELGLEDNEWDYNTFTGERYAKQEEDGWFRSLSDEYIEHLKNVAKQKKENTSIGLDLLKKYYHDLWD